MRFHLRGFQHRIGRIGELPSHSAEGASHPCGLALLALPVHQHAGVTPHWRLLARQPISLQNGTMKWATVGFREGHGSCKRSSGSVRRPWVSSSTQLEYADCGVVELLLDRDCPQWTSRSLWPSLVAILSTARHVQLPRLSF